MTLPLSFHNSASASLETFVPINDSHIRLYVCGPTVYDHIHIGNARPIVIFDVLYRLLRHTYPHARVTYVRNITDIDDKIIQRAQEQQIPTSQLTKEATKNFLSCCQQLHTLPPDFQPKASEYIPHMVTLIEQLIHKGHAYTTDDNHVLCDTTQNPHYGSLSRRKPEEQLAGARIEVASHKKNPTDFVLWKPSSPDQPGWDSPWGFGRPGWHTECVAMSSHILGNHFDIHGGGIDLLFPHHENERHQAQCLHPHSPFANFWIHNGYVVVNDEKMSKSLGNFLLAKDVIQEHSGLLLKIALLMTHYRKPLNLTPQRIQEALSFIHRYNQALVAIQPFIHQSLPPLPLHTLSIAQDLAQDLNTYKALSHLSTLASRIIDNPSPQHFQQFRLAASLLGLPLSPQKLPKTTLSDQQKKTIQDLIDQRVHARKNRQFTLADELRVKIEDFNVSLVDHSDGSSSWTFKPS